MAKIFYPVQEECLIIPERAAEEIYQVKNKENNNDQS